MPVRLAPRMPTCTRRGYATESQVLQVVTVLGRNVQQFQRFPLLTSLANPLMVERTPL